MIEEGRQKTFDRYCCQIKAINKKKQQQHTCTFLIKWYFWRDWCVYWLFFSSHCTPCEFEVNLWSSPKTKISRQTLCHVSGSFPERFCGIAKDVMVGNQRHSGMLVSWTALDLVECFCEIHWNLPLETAQIWVFQQNIAATVRWWISTVGLG